jgi:hypothetical protein
MSLNDLKFSYAVINAYFKAVEAFTAFIVSRGCIDEATWEFRGFEAKPKGLQVCDTYLSYGDLCWHAVAAFGIFVLVLRFVPIVCWLAEKALNTLSSFRQLVVEALTRAWRWSQTSTLITQGPVLLPSSDVSLAYNERGPYLTVMVDGSPYIVQNFSQRMLMGGGGLEMSIEGSQSLLVKKPPAFLVSFFCDGVQVGQGFRHGDLVITCHHVWDVLRQFQEDDKDVYLVGSINKQVKVHIPEYDHLVLRSDSFDIVGIKFTDGIYASLGIRNSKIGSAKRGNRTVRVWTRYGDDYRAGLTNLECGKQLFEVTHRASTAAGHSGAPITSVGDVIVAMHLGFQGKENYALTVDFLEFDKFQESDPQEGNFWQREFRRIDADAEAERVADEFYEFGFDSRTLVVSNRKGSNRFFIHQAPTKIGVHGDYQPVKAGKLWSEIDSSDDEHGLEVNVSSAKATPEEIALALEVLGVSKPKEEKREEDFPVRPVQAGPEPEKPCNPVPVPAKPPLEKATSMEEIQQEPLSKPSSTSNSQVKKKQKKKNKSSQEQGKTANPESLDAQDELLLSALKLLPESKRAIVLSKFASH